MVVPQTALVGLCVFPRIVVVVVMVVIGFFYMPFGTESCTRAFFTLVFGTPGPSAGRENGYSQIILGSPWHSRAAGCLWRRHMVWRGSRVAKFHWASSRRDHADSGCILSWEPNFKSYAIGRMNRKSHLFWGRLVHPPDLTTPTSLQYHSHL